MNEYKFCFVKNEWFLYVDKHFQHFEILEDYRIKQGQKRFTNSILGTALNPIEAQNILTRHIFESERSNFYCKGTERGAILINKNGGYRYFNSDDKVKGLIYKKNLVFPSLEVKKYDVVVCENDLDCPQEWKNQFPDKNIYIISNFRYCTPEEISESFENTKVISAYSTYTKSDWFELMLDVIIAGNYNNKTLILGVNELNYILLLNMMNFFDKKIQTVKKNNNTIEIIKIYDNRFAV